MGRVLEAGGRGEGGHLQGQRSGLPHSAGQPDCRHVGGRGRVHTSAREAPNGQLRPWNSCRQRIAPSQSHSSWPLPHFFLAVGPLNSHPVYSFKITLSKLVQRELHPCTPVCTFAYSPSFISSKIVSF